ncbi:translation initiation factor IF-6 [Methanobrevibacter cuticularis]|uniref:Translation initiation factor 6 n=1 Tax=Methanobrevibacter cuticularis TaxID=47311 RepID=A0A166EKN8_9EURY|nr:translation initiation factor IF-6 [Methanobrevibacter cuticularis]KZX16762.1 translation initiation factor IF-6 [Methanobrevibacter cuticularis]
MLKRINLTGNPNLGVYITVTDEIAIVPFNLPEIMENNIKEALDIDVIRTSIAGSNLVGALAIGNSNGIIVSPFAFDREIELLESYGLNIAKIPDKYTAVGNIIAANDKGAIVSPLLSSKSLKIVEETLDIRVERSEIAGFDIIGSLVAVTNKGALLHKDASFAELKLAKSVFKVEAEIGTVGRGIALVGACSIANSYGAIVPESSTGPEMARIEEALGFLEEI